MRGRRAEGKQDGGGDREVDMRLRNWYTDTCFFAENSGKEKIQINPSR